MAGVYSSCTASSWLIAAAPTPDTPIWTRSLHGYWLLVRCGYGVEFKRWVAPEDADEDLRRSALVAFEN